MTTENTLSPAHQRRHDATPLTLTVPRGLLVRALESIDYEIADRTRERPIDEERDSDSQIGREILEELYSDQAQWKHLLNEDSDMRITVRTVAGEFRVDLRGYPEPDSVMPSGYQILTRVDLPEWRVRHPHEEPKAIDIKELTY